MAPFLLPRSNELVLFQFKLSLLAQKISLWLVLNTTDR
jgi:hypothetical protein